ncbi:MAG: hypothetical protein WCR01_01940 [Bacteroidota bacterium]
MKAKKTSVLNNTIFMNPRVNRVIRSIVGKMLILGVLLPAMILLPTCRRTDSD